MVSGTHQLLMNGFFLPSIKHHEPSANIDIKTIDQVCNGTFYSHGWHKAMEFKIDRYIEACRQTWGEYFIWADVDIEFYDKFIEYCVDFLGDADIAFQQSHKDDVCAGFFIAKSNSTNLDFFRLIKSDYNKHGCDQNAINFHKSKINYKIFPNDTIWSPLKYWDGTNLTITKNAKLAHANYVIGIQNKILLLTRARKEMQYSIEYQQSNNIKILQAIYGKANTVNNISFLKDKTSNNQYLYLFDNQYNIIKTMNDKEINQC